MEFLSLAQEAMVLDHYQTPFLSVRILPKHLLLIVGHELDQNQYQRLHKKWSHFFIH